MNARQSFAAVSYQTHSTPPKRAGQIEYHWQALEDEPVICHLEYTPPERGAREFGLQIDPDYPADCTLEAAYVCGVNIIDLLSQDQCRRIEEFALIEHCES